MRAAWKSFSRELEETARWKVQFAARSMDKEGLMQNVDIVTQDEAGVETGRESLRAVLVAKEGGQDLPLGSNSYVDFYGRVFIGVEITPPAGPESLGVIKKLREVSDDWYSHNSGNVMDAWGRRIDEVSAEYAKTETAKQPQ